MRLIDLPWLPEPPDNLRQQARSISSASLDARDVARRLARTRLSGSQLHLIGKAVQKLSEQDGDAIRLGVLANATVDLLYPALAVSALRHGVWLHVIGTAFDQIAAQALDMHSEIQQSKCHYILLCMDHHALPLTVTPGDLDAARDSVESALRYTDSIRNGLRANSDCTVILGTVPQVPTTLFGSLERNVPGTLAWLIDRYNQEIRLRVQNSSDLLLDTAALAEMVGTDEWHDPAQWALGKFPFSQSLIPLYAEWVGRLVAAARGKSRKCLVLDLDNTVWGGVIGDDGLAGIVLGNGNPAGEAYLSVQQTALMLRDRGIVLAVSSKNDDAVARSPFCSHPDMLLKEEHITVFQANWQDKASNLAAIARALNFGVDALVLLDDNPVERAQVREALPDVAVPELPADPAFYVQTLLAAGYFETVVFTSEDRQRAQQYAENAARSESLGAATDLESHLQSLAMRAVCGPFDHIGRARITQLINKTNQFNLTTRRYAEADVAALESSSATLTLQVRLLDRFGDNGMIAVVICVPQGQDWEIDTWLMSCRVLNRKVEQAMLNHIVDQAKTRGIRNLVGEYVRSERNGMVSDHYSKLGFSVIQSSSDASKWQLDVASYVHVPVPIDIVAIDSMDGLK